jgi:Mycotoxin biosynthesis protein UstYa
MFHQLHCLMRIRETLFITKLAINRTNAEKIDEDLIEPSMMHVYHCFDYIRQALMCAGDLTLEWPRTEKDGRRFAVDGWGVSHQCKSWVCQQSVLLVLVLIVRNRKPSRTT